MPSKKFNPSSLSPDAQARILIIQENIGEKLQQIVVDHWLSCQVVAGEDEDKRASFMMTALNLTLQHTFCLMNAIYPEMLQQDEEHVINYLLDALKKNIHGHFEDGPCLRMVSDLNRMVREKTETPQHDTHS